MAYPYDTEDDPYAGTPVLPTRRSSYDTLWNDLPGEAPSLHAAYAPDVNVGAGTPSSYAPGAGGVEPAAPAAPRYREVDTGGAAGAERYQLVGDLVSLADPEMPPAARLGAGQEFGRGLVRSVVEPFVGLDLMANRALAWAADKLDLPEGVAAAKQRIKDHEEFLNNFRQEWAPQDGSFVEAYRNAGAAGVFNHLAGAMGQIIPEVLPIARAKSIPTVAAYFGVLEGVKASVESHGDPGATAAGLLTGALAGGASQKIIMSTLGKQWYTDTLAKIAALTPIGAAQTAAQPAYPAIAGEKPYQLPGVEQFVEGAALNALLFGGVAAAQRLAGGRPTPPAAATPPVDPAVNEAVTLALPPPSSGNRPPVPPGRQLTAPAMGGDVIAGGPPAEQSRLPAPGPGNRPPVIEVPPEPGQAGPADIVPSYPREAVAAVQAAVETPRLSPTPATQPELPLPRAAPSRGPGEQLSLPEAPTQLPMPLRTPEPLQPRPGTPELPGVRLPQERPQPELPAVETPQQPRLPLGEPGAARPIGEVPAAPTPELSTRGPLTAPLEGATREGWRVEPDHTGPGHVVKNADGNVIAVGDTPAQALEFARARSAENVAPVTTRSEPGGPRRLGAEQPATVGQALAEARAAGEKPVPKTVVERVKRRKVEAPRITPTSEIAKPLAAQAEPVSQRGQPTQKPGILSLRVQPGGLARRAEVEAATRAREEALEVARQRPAPAPGAPALEAPAAPLRAAPKTAAARETLGDRARVPRAEQTSAEQLASTTTNRDEIGRALLRDLVTEPERMSIAKAAAYYGTQPTGAGRRRVSNDLHDYAVRRVREIEAEQKINADQISKLSTLHADERAALRAKGLTSSTKLTRIENRITDLVKKAEAADELPRLREVRDQLAAHLKKGEAPPERPAEVEAGVSELEARAREIARERGEDVVGMRGEGVVRDLRSDLVNEPVRRRTEAVHRGDSESLHAYLDDIIKHPPARALAPHYVALAQQLKRLLGSQDVQVVSMRKAAERVGFDPESVKEYTGAYFPEHDIIGINTQRPTIELLLHEGVHKATYRYLNDITNRMRSGDKLSSEELRHFKAITAIADEVRRIAITSELTPLELGKFMYARSRTEGHEIVTLAMTDPHFQRAMVRTASPELRQAMRQLGYQTSRDTTIWSAFKQLVSSIFRFSSGSRGETALDLVLRPLTDIVEAGGTRERLRTGAAAGRVEFAGQRAEEPGMGPRRRGGEVPTDSIPDRRTREAVRPMGRLYAAEFGPGQGGWMQKLGQLYNSARLPFRARQALLQVAGTDQIARWNDDLPWVRPVVDARASVARAADLFREKYSAATHDLIDRLQAGPGGQIVSTLLRDVGEFKGGVSARLSGRDFEVDNAHLNPEQLERARALKSTFEGLVPSDQQLYRDVIQHKARINREERQATLDHLLDVAMPGITPAERASLHDALRTKTGTEALIRNPDAGPVAEAFGERYQHSRKLVEELARFWNHGHIEGDYFPLRRYGDWILEYGDKGSPEHGVEFFERRNEALARRDELLDLGETDIGQVKRKDAFSARDVIPESLSGRLDDALRARGLAEEQANTVKDVLAGLILRNAGNATRARMAPQRQGTAGASTDAVRILSEDLGTTASRMGYLQHGGEERAAMLEAGREYRRMHQPGATADQRTVERAGQVLDELKARSAPLDGDRSGGAVGTVGRGFTRASYVYQLMRFAKPVLQLADNNAKAVAFLGGRYGYGRSTAAFSKALLDVAPEAWRSGFHNMAQALGGKLQAHDWDQVGVMRDRLVERGMPEEHARALMEGLGLSGRMTHSMAYELRRMSQAGGFDTTSARSIGGAGGRLAGNMMDLFAAGEHAIDVMNVTAMGKAAFDLAMRRNGNNVAASVAEAVELVSRAVPGMSSWNMPRIATPRGSLGEFGAPLLQYKIYGMQMYGTMTDLVRRAMTRPGERAEALKTLAGLYGIHSLLIGGTANIFGSLVLGGTGMFDFLSGKDRPHDYEKDVLRAVHDMAGPQVSELVRTGLLGQLGIDARRNIGLGNMAGVPELASFDQAGYAKFMAAALGGPSGGLGQQLFGAGHDMLTGQYGKAAAGVAPRALRDILRAGQMATGGLTDPRGSVILRPENISPGAVTLTALGFNPSEISGFRDRRYAGIEARNEQSDARKQATDAFIRSSARDLSGVRAYNQMAVQRRWPLIQYSQLLDQYRQERKQSADLATYGLRESPRQRQYMLPATQF